MEATALAAEAMIDQSPTKDDALKNAIAAADWYMKATKLASNDQERARLRNKCEQLLSRAEEIKQSPRWTPGRNDASRRLKAPKSERPITTTEEIILLEGSKLHGFIFPPWTAEPTDNEFEEASGSRLYTEPADLELSECQREIFDGWLRPHETFNRFPETQDCEIHDEDRLMHAVKQVDLVQDITTDCSVVASLCAGTARALKGHGKVLASIIYPYDRTTRRPRVSKNGKYIFCLHFNGCFRKVTIDDRLPASKSHRCLHVLDRNNPQLLWPALIEKAYLKVRGGYDFPGSNSGTDLWVLTGWIPEQVFLRSDDVEPEQLWGRVHKSFSYGDVMLTLGTGKLTRREERELGLAGEHDYAILDMREVGSQRLMLVKNPWCDGMVWKGSSTNFWTDDLREALPDEPEGSLGTFWMSFEDVAQHFESLYLNWNPGLFLKRQDHHFSWEIPKIRSPGSFAHSPQYTLRPTSKGTVWVLLSRHFHNGEHNIIKQPGQKSSALGFISIYIFEGNGRRVYLSDDSLHRGAYVDSPQTLARLEVDPQKSYTIVAAQHGLPLPKYSFTLSVFSRIAVKIEQATDHLPCCSIHSGSWNVRTAGGNASAPTYPSNPQFSISVPSISDVLLILETDQEELAVHVKLVWGNGDRVTAVTAKDILFSSGDYRRGCALAELPSVQPGKYTIVCSTFEAGQTGNFRLRVGSMVPCVVRPVLAETAGRLSLRPQPLRFQAGVDRMLAPLTLTRLTKLRVVARSGGSPTRHTSNPRSRALIKISLERGQGPNKTILDVSGDGDFSDAPMGTRTADLDLAPETRNQGGLWIVVEKLGGRNDGVGDNVEVEVLSDGPVAVGLWGTGGG